MLRLFVVSPHVCLDSHRNLRKPFGKFFLSFAKSCSLLLIRQEGVFGCSLPLALFITWINSILRKTQWNSAKEWKI